MWPRRPGTLVDLIRRWPVRLECRTRGRLQRLCHARDGAGSRQRRRGAASRAAFEAHGHADEVDGAFRADLATLRARGLLFVMADRMSMAHSLELRAPFCDHTLLETSLALPPVAELRHGPPQGASEGGLRRRPAHAILAQPKRGS